MRSRVEYFSTGHKCRNDTHTHTHTKGEEGREKGWSSVSCTCEAHDGGGGGGGGHTFHSMFHYLFIVSYFNIEIHLNCINIYNIMCIFNYSQHPHVLKPFNLFKKKTPV